LIITSSRVKLIQKCQQTRVISIKSSVTCRSGLLLFYFYFCRNTCHYFFFDHLCRLKSSGLSCIYHYKCMVLALNILKLSDLYHNETTKFMYLVLKNNFPLKLKYFLTTVNSVHSRSTRSAVSKKLSVPYFSLTKFQKSIAYQGVKIWNTVPDSYKKMSYRQSDSYKKMSYRQFKAKYCFNLTEINRTRNNQMS